MSPNLVELMLAERRREIDAEIAKRQLLRSLKESQPRRKPLGKTGCRFGKLLVAWGERLQRYGESGASTWTAGSSRG